MVWFARLALVPVALLLGLVGVGFLLAPERVAEGFAVTATGPFGLGNLRSDIGGPFLAMAAFVATAAVRKDAGWLVFPLIAMGCVLLGRALGFALDGFDPRSVRSTVIEVVFVVLMLAARAGFRRG